MSNGNDFQDKANRLFHRLNAVTNPAKIVKNKTQFYTKTATPQELLKIKEEIQSSDFQTRKKMKILNDNLKKIQVTLIDENQNRTKMDQTFTITIGRLEKNMKTVLSSVQKSFNEKEKKLEQKIQNLIKMEKKEIEAKINENDELIEDMNHLQTKVQAIIDEVGSLRKSRLQIEQKISKQFSNQLKQLKRIFQSDVRERQQRQTKSLVSLKSLYKNSMERIYTEQRQRQQNEKLLITVVEQLVNHIIQA